MKRELKCLSVLLLLVCLVSAFTGCKTQMDVIDCTVKGFDVELAYNQYGPNYQGYGPVVSDSFELVKGKNIKVSISGVSDTDLAELQFFIVDPSEAAGWWLEITSSTAFVLNDIKAGKKFEETAVIKVINNPVSRSDTKICFSTTAAKKTVKLSDLTVTLSNSDTAAIIEKLEDKNGNASIADISSINLVKEMKAGWNLGNTLDAFVTGDSGLGSETCWGNPRTTQQIVHMGTANGYKTIRIPVTWFNHIIDENYTIDPAWMKRVKTIVDWAIADGYYVILNEHHSVHDDMNSPLGYGDGYIVRNTKKDIAESEAFLKAVWTQVAAAFNTSYDEHLIFETMNEPRNTGHGHCWYPDLGDNAGCAECKADYKILNKYNQICLDAIRASGGPNANRFVMIPSLCTADYSTYHELFKFPEDTATDKLILTVHNYVMGVDKNTLPSKFKPEFEGTIDNLFSSLNTSFISKGIPVVIGETGAMRYISASERTKWITYFAGKANEYGASVVYWDDGGNFRVFDRQNCKLVSGNEAFVKAFADAFN